ncbi:TPA: serine acetyltransferase, partial [Klebsiella pneumoniae]|nr:serine acetyltransferase [Klebsiella pneumoniae]
AGQVVVGQPFRVLHTHREMQE